MLDKFTRQMTRHPRIVVVFAVLLLIPSLYGIVSTRINYDILTYLPDSLDSTKGQQILENTFQNAATSMLIIEDMPSKDVLKIKGEVEKVPGVSDVIWISDLIDIGVPEEILPDEIKDVFYSGDSTLLMIKYDNPSSSEITMEAIGKIRSFCNKQCFLSGMSAIIKDTKDLADREVPVYVGLAVALSLVAMTLFMESWLLPFIFLLGIFFAVAYNFGSNIFLGRISYITKSIAAVLQLGVTMDYSIFLINRYDEEKRNYDDKRDAMAKAVRSTFVSLAGSSLTTIAGFLALCFMELTLGKDIGLVMMKGVAIGVLTVVTVLPALILMLDKPIHKYRHRSLMPEFSGVADFVLKHKKTLAVLFLLAFIPAYMAQKNTSVYYNLDESLPKDLESIVATNKLKSEFNMASTHFVILDDSLPAYRLNGMAKDIEKLDGVENVFAYNKFVGPAIPDSFIPQKIKDICKKDGLQIVMVNSRYKAATDEENRQIDRLTEIVKGYDPNAYITGEGPLTKDLIEISDHDFAVTNYISVLSIFLIVALVFKSLSIPVILVAVIELAIFINVGIPFFTGSVIPFISPTVIGCVQLGATVDYAILLTTRFHEELKNGLEKTRALTVAANTSCKSVMMSALVFFCATFGVSLVSRIEIIESICAMLARGALISAGIIIFILSPLLFLMEKIIAKTTWRWN